MAIYTICTNAHQGIADFITIAVAHGGRVLPAETTTSKEDGMGRSKPSLLVTVEVPDGEAADSFRLIADQTGLIDFNPKDTHNLLLSR